MHEKITLNVNSSIIIIAVVLLYISILPSKNSMVGYIDDIVPLFFACIGTYYYLISNYKSEEKRLFIILIVICFIGLVSNAISGLTSTIHAVIDLYSFMKMFFVFLGVRVVMQGRKKSIEHCIRVLGKLAIVFIATGFVCSILNYLGLVNMYDSVRFGIKNYYFIYSNPSQYGVLVGTALAFVLFYASKCRWIFVVEVMAIVTMILTMKGMSLIIASIYILMKLIVYKKIKVWQIVIVSVALIFVLRYQITTYLLDDDAPRAILIKYGCVTANKYFPFGSGFGTYGSDIAGKFYSPLYVKYGFLSRPALTYNYAGGTALNDAYIAMAIGQFGWIGAAMLIVIFVLIGKRLLKYVNKNSEKCGYIATGLYACLCGMATMAGSIKGGAGQVMFLALQMFFLMRDNDSNDLERA